MVVYSSKEICDQFALDAPRIQIIVDDEVCHDPPAVLLCDIINRYANGLVMAQWCTQTALADIYIKKLEQIQKVAPTLLSQMNGASHARDREESRLHLVDGGKQINHFEKESVQIYKPFQLCLANDEGLQTLRHMTLFIRVQEDSTYTVKWKVLPHTPSHSVPKDGDGRDDDGYEIISKADEMPSTSTYDSLSLRVIAVLGLTIVML